MDILGISSTVFQPFDGLSGTRSVVGADGYILTPAASATTLHVFPVSASATYILTPAAVGAFARPVSASSTYIMTPSDGAISVFEVEAGPTYIFTPGSSSVVNRVGGVGIGTDVPTYIFTPQASATVDWKVAAASTYIFTPDASERHVEEGDTSVTYIFAAAASSLKEFVGGIGGEGEGPTYIFTPQADSHVPNPHRDTDPITYIFEATATAVVVALVCTPLGRFRRGDVVPIELTLPFIPDQPPVAAVLDDMDEVVAVFSMARSPTDPGIFRSDLFVGTDYQLERYILVFTVLTGGVQVKQIDQCFTVIGGGDAGGPVISLVCYQRGKTQAVLAHLGSGELVMGRNPSLDYTPPSVLSR